MAVPAASSKDYKIQTEWEYRKWNVHDFRGKFHKQRIHATYPIPGSQIVAEREREANEAKRHDSLEGALGEIRTREAETIKHRCRHERASGNAKVFGQINDALGRVKDVVKDLKEMDLFGDGAGDEDEEATDTGPSKEEEEFLHHVETRDVFNLTKMLKSGFIKTDTKFPESGDSALHVAVKYGNIEMVKLLLHFRANPNVHNISGDAPIHQAWRFWRHHANTGRLSFEEKVRKECAEDDHITYELLLALLQGGADPNIGRTERSTALHEAARRGPVKAVVVLLQVCSPPLPSLCIAGARVHTARNRLMNWHCRCALRSYSSKLKVILPTRWAIPRSSSPKQQRIWKRQNSFPAGRGLWASIRRKSTSGFFVCARFNVAHGDAATSRPLPPSRRFTTAWAQFCKDPEASMQKAETAQQLVKKVELVESQEALSRAQQEGVAVVDDVASDLRTACDEGSSRRRILSQKQWKEAERTKFYPPASNIRTLSVPIDEYLEGSSSGAFNERSRRLAAGSFAHATAQLVGERNFMTVNWVEGTGKKKKAAAARPSVSKVRQRRT